MVTLSKDGYVRMTPADFNNIPLEHFMSGLDEDHVTSHHVSTDACTISGYTEWISTISPVITIGWDWLIDVTHGRPHYLLVGFPRSNVMFRNAAARDLGHIRTAALLKDAITTIHWQVETAKAISVRYASTT